MPQFYQKLISAEEAFTFRDFILLPGLSEVEPAQAKLATRFTKDISLNLPFVSSPMDTVTEEQMAIALARQGGIGVIHRNVSVEAQVRMARKVKEAAFGREYSQATKDREGRLRVAAAISPLDLMRARALEKYVDTLVADVSHFHNANILSASKRLVKETSVPFVAGNMGTKRAVEDTITRLERVDALRVGIGSGSTCITGEVARVGAPTLFAVAQAADTLRTYGLDIPIIADGGIRTPGDAAIALAAGASCVMMGYVFAACSESAGKLVKVKGRYYKSHRGMGSHAARAKRIAFNRYMAPAKGIAEGVEGLVPYKGEVAKVVEEFEAGLKAAFGYAGAKNIGDLWVKAQFAKVTPAGITELRPHGLLIAGGEWS